MGFKSSNLSVKNQPKVTPLKPDMNQLTGRIGGRRLRYGRVSRR